MSKFGTRATCTMFLLLLLLLLQVSYLESTYVTEQNKATKNEEFLENLTDPQVPRSKTLLNSFPLV